MKKLILEYLELGFYGYMAACTIGVTAILIYKASEFASDLYRRSSVCRMDNSYCRSKCLPLAYTIEKINTPYSVDIDYSLRCNTLHQRRALCLVQLSNPAKNKPSSF